MVSLKDDSSERAMAKKRQQLDFKNYSYKDLDMRIMIFNYLNSQSED